MLCSSLSSHFCYLQIASVITSATILLFLTIVNLLFCCLKRRHNNIKSPVGIKTKRNTKVKGHTVRWILMIVTLIVHIFKLSESSFSTVMYYLSSGQILCMFALDDFFSLSLLLVVAVTYTYMVEVSKQYRFLWVLWTYWITVIAFKLLAVALFHWNGHSFLSSHFLFTVILLVFYFSMFLLDTYLNFSKCLSSPSSAKLNVSSEEKTEDIVYTYPYEIFPSQITWHWLNGLLVQGYRKALEVEDLGILPQDETAKKNFLRFKQLFEKEVISAKAKGVPPSLWKCYLRSQWYLVVVSAVCKIFYDVAVFVPPMCLDKIVDYVIAVRNETGNATLIGSVNTTPAVGDGYFVSVGEYFSNGFILCLVLLVAALVQGFCMQFYLYLSAKNGIRLKGALQAMVYHKTLQLPSKCLTDGQMSQGQVLNHMSVDSINIFMLFSLGHLTWGIPFQVLVGCVLLYIQLGYTTLISIAIILVSCPIQYLLGNRIAGFQKRALALADERIKKSNETLQSMKLLKLYGWEKLFAKSILETRHREVMVYLKAGLCRVMAILVTDGTPILTCVVTFTLYPYLEKKPLTPGKVFSSYAIMMIINLCLFLTPFVINIWSHAIVSTRRLHSFLTAEELAPSELTKDKQQEEHGGQDKPVTNSDNSPVDQEAVISSKKADKDKLVFNNQQLEDVHLHSDDSSTGSKKPSQDEDILLQNNGHLDGASLPSDHPMDESHVVQITQGAFTWDSKSSSDLVLQDINLTVQKGKLTMIVGAVGTGKSSLLSALLGEMVQQAGSVRWSSGMDVAYGSQKAWLLNASFRDNVLFGKPYQSQWYNSVVKACALQPDIDMLMAGDETEIGEKGINVSGGQKQRISLARAMYSGASVILLDDPFSALDAHVGGHIFEEGIRKLLIQQQKTIVLVTHQLHYLPFADEIIAMKSGTIVARGTYKTLLRTSPEIFRIIEQENLEEEDHLKDPPETLSRSKLHLHIPEVIQRDLIASSPKLSPMMPHNILVHRENSTSPLAECPGSPPSMTNSSRSRTKSHTDVGSTHAPEDKVSLLRFRMLTSTQSQEHLTRNVEKKSHDHDEIEMSAPTASRLASSLTSLTHATVEEDGGDLRKSVLKEHIAKEAADLSLAKKGQLIEKEERETGSVSLRVCWKYTKAASIGLVFCTLAGYILRQVARMGTDIWLAEWSEAGVEAETLLKHPNYTNLTLNDTYDLQYFVRGYMIWQAISSVFLVLGITSLECMTLNASRNLHRRMVKAVVMAPMRFFDTTPIGRIINRMSGDSNKLDEHMPVTVDNFLFCVLYVLGGVVLNAMFIPIFIIPALVMLLLYFFVQRFYITSCREMQRLDSITKSPILAHFSETLGGLPTIRAYGHQWRFQEQNWRNIDTNNTAFLFLHTTNGWMGVRLDSIGSFITFFSAVLTITWGVQGRIEPSIVGIAIAYATTMSSFLNWFMRNLSELEMWLNAAERITHYTGIQPEANVLTSNTPEDWPNSGEIQFCNVSLRYDPTLQPVVKNLDLCIKPGEKVGICGRTGSGKSSLTLSIFNMIDICEGCVLIDGLDIKTVTLHELRSRLAIIPQDPILFSGTVRYNLDPEGHYADERLWESLHIAQLKPVIHALPDQLDAKVDESGDNFSVGQRQLFCLARAFLRDAKILVMDEPTASVDMATDAVIQEISQSAFKDKTVITIAHRVATILNYDMIVVMEAGRIVAKGSPKQLMQDKAGVFVTMLKQNQ